MVDAVALIVGMDMTVGVLLGIVIGLTMAYTSVRV